MSTLTSQLSSEGILVITLNNPLSANSFGPSEADQLGNILRQKKWREAMGLIFCSTGRTFCSGGNLRYYASLKTRAAGLSANRKIRKSLSALAQFEIPSVAVVEGDCFGGGMELLSCFDYIVSAPHCLFGFWQRRIGLTYGWGGGARWLGRLSQAQLKNLTLNPRVVNAYEALHLGMIDEVAPVGLFQRAQQWILNSEKFPHAPVEAIKNFSAQKETNLFEKLWGNKEHRKVLKSRR